MENKRIRHFPIRHPEIDDELEDAFFTEGVILLDED